MTIRLPVRVVDYIEPRLVDADGKTLACAVDENAKETLTQLAALVNRNQNQQTQEPDF